MAASILEWVGNYGYWAIFIGSAADHTGLPTTLILFTGLAASGKLDIWLVLFAYLCGGVVADILLYLLGCSVRRKIAFGMPRNARVLRMDNTTIERITHLLHKHGPALLVWGRYYPIVSRYIPFICGVINVRPRTFMVFSALGLTLMTLTFGLSFYYFGQRLNFMAKDPLASVYLTLLVVGLQLLIVLLARLRRNLWGTSHNGKQRG